MIRQVVAVLVLVVAVPYLMNQVRRPTRWVGRLAVWWMNWSHSELTDWGLKHVPIERNSSILDVGCGGGRSVQKMAAIATEGRVIGVDYSVGSADAARAKNAPLIRAGRVEIRQAPVSQLPFPDRTFDFVTAIETHYYWPDLPGDLKEVLRVVKPGGMAIVIGEAYRSRNDRMQGPAMKLLRAALLSADEHREWFVAAGFSEVQVFEERSQGWICVTGRRPG